MNTTTTPFQLHLPAGLPANARHGLRLLQRLQQGTLHLELPDGSILQLGQGSHPHASLRLHDWRVFGAVLRSGDIGLAEGYIDQQWSTPHLTAVLPDVQPGDRLTGLYQPGQGMRLWRGQQPLGAIDDAELARRFFGIWLSPRTSEPSLRSALLARKPGAGP